MSIFEQASRLRVRFDSTQGALSVEDLWDLPLTSKTNKANLDDIAKALHKQLQTSDEVSFVQRSVTSDKNARDALKFEIVKHIISVRLEENEVAAKARQNAEKKQKILEILAERQDSALKDASDDDLKRMLSELQTAS